MNSAGVELLSNVSVTGAGAVASWPGGIGVFSIGGTFGGTSVTLEFRLPDGSWGPFQTLATDGTRTTVAMTTSGGFQFALPCGQIRANVTGGVPVGLFARADRLSI